MPDKIKTLEAKVARARTDLDSAKALNELAWELRYQDVRYGIELAEHAREIARSLASANSKHETLLADVRATLCALYHLRGDYESALSEGSGSLSAFRAQGDTAGQIKALRELGQSFVDIGEISSGLDCHLEALALSEKLGSPYDVALCYARIGIAHSHSDDFKTALDYYFKALPIFEQLGDVHQQAALHNNASIEYRALDDFSNALKHATRSFELYSQIGEAHGRIHAMGSIGESYAGKGDHKRALEALNQRVDQARDSGYRPMLAYALMRLGQFHFQQGNYAQAIAAMNSAALDAKDMGQPAILVECYKVLANSYEAQGDLRQALDNQRTYSRLAGEAAHHNNAARSHGLAIRQQLESALQEAERYRYEKERLEDLREQDRRYFERLSQIKDDVMNATTHDLKNPLTSILMYSDLLRKKLPEDDQGQKLLDGLNDQVVRMQNMVRSLLDLARLETGRALNRQSTPINPLLRDVIDTYAVQAEFRNIHLTFKPIRGQVIMNIDATQVRSALDNLVSNAIKYTPTGGQVAVEAARQGDLIAIAVRDTGMGIPAADVPHLFERFYRVGDQAHQDIEGSGLGLAIAHTIIEQHGGRIDIETKPGKGSTFTLVLPINGTPLPAVGSNN